MIRALPVVLIAVVSVVASIAVVRSRQSEFQPALEGASDELPALVPLDLDELRAAGF